jgi:hypothetical protein
MLVNVWLSKMTCVGNRREFFIPNLHLIGKAKTEVPYITLIHIFKKNEIGDKLMPFMGDC